MAHFAEINPNTNIVLRVIVAEQDFINSGAVGDNFRWIQTSYNTKGGIHSNGDFPLRKNYAGVGFTYDKIRDAFIAPKPYNSWTLNETACQWEAPTIQPELTVEQESQNTAETHSWYYLWNESTTAWDLTNSLI